MAKDDNADLVGNIGVFYFLVACPGWFVIGGLFFGGGLPWWSWVSWAWWIVSTILSVVLGAAWGVVGGVASSAAGVALDAAGGCTLNPPDISTSPSFSYICCGCRLVVATCPLPTIEGTFWSHPPVRCNDS